MKSKINYEALIIYPPLVRLGIYTYYLSVPLLSAQLIKNSINTKQLDLNKDSIYTFLNINNLNKIKNECYQNIQQNKDSRDMYKELLVEVEYGIKNIVLIKQAEETGDFRINGVEISKIFHRLFEFLENGSKIKGENCSSKKDFFDNFFDDEYIYKHVSKYIIKEDMCIIFSITMGPQLKPSIAIAKRIKKIFKNVKIIFGGPVISLMSDVEHKKMLYEEAVDVLMRYEGEVELPKLIKRIINGDSYDDICNITYLKSKEFCSNRKRYNTCDLNIIEFPKYDSEIIDKYKIDTISILQSRGCYWKRCSFCDYTNLYGDYNYNSRNCQSICKEILTLKSKYGFTKYRIINESMTSSYARKFSQELINNNLDIEWITFIKVEKGCFDYHTFKLMKEAGCTKVIIGVESLDDDVLKNLNKGYKRQDVLDILEAVKGSNIQVVINLIIDAPITTWKSALEQFQIFKSLVNEMDVTYNFFSFELTRTSNMGKNPAKYGLKIISDGYLEESMKGLTKNTFKYTHKYKWSEENLNYIKSAYYNLNLLSDCKKYYPKNYAAIKNKLSEHQDKLSINEKNKLFKYIFLDDITHDEEEYLLILHNSLIIKNDILIQGIYELIQENKELTIGYILDYFKSINEKEILSKICSLLLYKLISIK